MSRVAIILGIVVTFGLLSLVAFGVGFGSNTYLFQDGSTPLTDNWDVGAFTITANQLNLTSLFVSSSIFGDTRFVRTSSGTNTIRGSVAVQHRTTANMVDGFGSTLAYEIRDSEDVNHLIGHIAVVRDGADNSGKLLFRPVRFGVGYTRLSIDSLGRSEFIGASWAVLTVTRTSAVTNTLRGGFAILHKTTANMVDGFASSFTFQIEDATSGVRGIARIDAIRDGADNSGKMVFNCYSAGAVVQVMTLIKDGQLSIPITGSSAGIIIGGDTHIFRGLANVLNISSGDKLSVGEDIIGWGDGLYNIGSGIADDVGTLYYHTLSQHSDRDIKENIVLFSPLTKIILPQIYTYNLKEQTFTRNVSYQEEIEVWGWEVVESFDEKNGNITYVDEWLPHFEYITKWELETIVVSAGNLQYGFLVDTINDPLISEDGESFDPIALLAKAIAKIHELEDRIEKLEGGK